MMYSQRPEDARLLEALVHGEGQTPAQKSKTQTYLAEEGAGLLHSQPHRAPTIRRT